MADGARMPEATADDWAKENQLRQEWLANNPDAEYVGWMSIQTPRRVTCGYSRGFDYVCYPEQKAFDLKSKS